MLVSILVLFSLQVLLKVIQSRLEKEPFVCDEMFLWSWRLLVSLTGRVSFWLQ